MKMKLGGWIALGAWVVLASHARAEGGFVERLQGNRALLKVGLMTVHVGERIGLNVAPIRRYGSGQAIVTDVDLLSHRVAVVLVPTPPDRWHREDKALREYPEEGIEVPRNKHDFKLMDHEVVTITLLHKYVSSVPDYKLPRPEPRSEPGMNDILLPEGIRLGPATTTSPSQ